MNRSTCIVGGFLLGVAYGAFVGGLLGSGAVAFGNWVHALSQGRSHWWQDAWMVPFWFVLFGVPVGGLSGAVLGARSFRKWEQKQSAKRMPPLKAPPDEHVWPPPPRQS